MLRLSTAAAVTALHHEAAWCMLCRTASQDVNMHVCAPAVKQWQTLQGSLLFQTLFCAVHSHGVARAVKQVCRHIRTSSRGHAGPAAAAQAYELHYTTCAACCCSVHAVPLVRPCCPISETGYPRPSGEIMAVRVTLLSSGCCCCSCCQQCCCCPKRTCHQATWPVHRKM
jgi:hypothetical protein